MKGTPVAIGWLDAGMMSIIKKRKDEKGLVKIDSNNFVLIPDDAKPRLIKITKLLPLPSKKWYPFYLASPEHAIALEVKDLSKREFTIKKRKTPGGGEVIEKIPAGGSIVPMTVSEAISTQIEPSLPRQEKGKIKYGIETMSAENLSTFLEGRQESMLQRITSSKSQIFLFAIMAGALGFLLGQVIPLGTAVAP